MTQKVLTGGCHCQKVRFEVSVEVPATIQTCNCSMCQKVGFIHLIVPAKNFRQTAGKSELTTYTFNTGVAQHYFCKHCGVKSFYVPRSNPDGLSINMRCLDRYDANDFKLEHFDGQNWEAHAHTLAHLT